LISRTIFVDENVMPQLAEPLCRVHRQHRFPTATSWSLRGIYDVELIDHLGARGCGAIITMDRMQLQRPDERAALRANGIHWIGFETPDASGTLLLAALTAITAPGVHHVLSTWSDTPRAYLLPQGNHARPPESEDL
jgi:hypothetical protein